MSGTLPAECLHGSAGQITHNGSSASLNQGNRFLWDTPSQSPPIMSWLELPRDVWEVLLLLLHRPELLALRLTCKSWKESLESSLNRLQPRSIEVQATSSLGDLLDDLAKHSTCWLADTGSSLCFESVPTRTGVEPDQFYWPQHRHSSTSFGRITSSASFDLSGELFNWQQPPSNHSSLHKDPGGKLWCLKSSKVYGPPQEISRPTYTSFSK